MKKSFCILDRLIEHSSRVGCMLASVAVLSITILISVEVVARNIFGVSIYVADEYSGYLLVAILFFGVAYSFRQDGLIRVDIIYKNVPPKFKYWLDIALHIISLLYSVILLQYFWSLAVESYQFNTTSTYISKTPLFIPHLFMVVGTILLILELFAGLVKAVINRVSFKPEFTLVKPGPKPKPEPRAYSPKKGEKKNDQFAAAKR